MLFSTPALDLIDTQIVDEIHTIRQELATDLRTPRRWAGGLRRTLAARAIQGSNTIEGYTISLEDAAAAVDDEPPLTADQETWAEILGYRRVLTYVIQVAARSDFVVDESALRSMHFMLLEHDLSKGPGQYRTGSVYVHDDQRDVSVYEGPPAADVPALMAELAQTLSRTDGHDPLIRAAMAHLNLVMIHPFRDGNGRMARALQTAVLAQDDVIEPTFSSIEEWLGRNTSEYYEVLAAVGQGSWHPEHDATLWLKFNLRAHHMQAQTVRRRFAEAGVQWQAIDDLLAREKLPERVGQALFDALLGNRVTRPTYLDHTDVDPRTATRDLVSAADAGLLEPRGQTKGRYYLAGPQLRHIREDLQSARRPLLDPYPGLADEVRRRR